jgi:micrococcal nuclease
MYEYNCKIVSVVDGDTVDVDIDLGFDTWKCGERIRLYGIDTPECRTRDAEEKAAGLAAKDFVKGLLHDGGTYTLTTKEKGKFGRYLGVIQLTDKTSVNGALVKERFAVAYYGQSKDDIQAAHLENRRILKERGVLK